MQILVDVDGRMGSQFKVPVHSSSMPLSQQFCGRSPQGWHASGNPEQGSKMHVSPLPQRPPCPHPGPSWQVPVISSQRRPAPQGRGWTPKRTSSGQQNSPRKPQGRHRNSPGSVGEQIREGAHREPVQQSWPMNPQTWVGEMEVVGKAVGEPVGSALGACVGLLVGARVGVLVALEPLVPPFPLEGMRPL
jgi:hypothetical protein